MMRKFLTLGMLSFWLACPGTRRTPDRAPTENQIQLSRASEFSRPSEGPSRDAGGQAAVDASVQAPPTPLTDAELADWLEQHDVRAAFRGHQCIPVRIGVPAADGLLCTEPLHGLYNEGSEEWKMWRRGGGRLSLVWRGRRNWERFVRLSLDIASSGDTFLLSETKRGACDNIYGQVYEKEEIGDPRETESVLSFCLQRGRYIWNRTRFVRDPRQRPCPPNEPGRWLPTSCANL
jgi:hypothetical protein